MFGLSATLLYSLLSSNYKGKIKILAHKRWKKSQIFKLRNIDRGWNHNVSLQILLSCMKLAKSVFRKNEMFIT